MLKKTGYAVFFTLVISSGVTQAEEVSRGQLLYENHCKKCHEPTVHERADSKVKNIVDISQFVIRWQYDQKLDWDYDEIRDVVNYLNKTYYHLRSIP